MTDSELVVPNVDRHIEAGDSLLLVGDAGDSELLLPALSPPDGGSSVLLSVGTGAAAPRDLPESVRHVLDVGGTATWPDGIDVVRTDGRSLSEAGRRLTELVESLPADRVRVGVSGVAALVETTDVQRTYRFLNVLTGQVARLDGLCVCSIPAAGLDKRTKRILARTFDHVVVFDGEIPDPPHVE